jgi:hypothetical protein
LPWCENPLIFCQLCRWGTTSHIISTTKLPWCENPLIFCQLCRWGTISHIISTTKLPWCEKQPQDETGDGTVDKEAIAFVHALQRDDTINTKDTDNDHPKLDRRGTIHNIAANLKVTQG